MDKGKDEEGKIEINCYRKNNDDLVIKLKDDGQGIDIKRLVEKAKMNNIIQTDMILKLIIFRPRFFVFKNLSNLYFFFFKYIKVNIAVNITIGRTNF